MKRRLFVPVPTRAPCCSFRTSKEDNVLFCVTDIVFLDHVIQVFEACEVQESLDPAFDCQDGAGIEAFCAKNPKVTAKGVMCTVKCDSDGAVREIVHDAVSLEDASGSTWSVLEPDPEKLQWHYTGYFLKLTVKLDPGEPLCLWRALCSKEEKDGIIEHHKHDATPVTEDDFWTLKFGYLTVPLDYDNTKPSHEITLSLRVSALIGPAGPHAPLILQHNGGPVSDDLDVLYGVLSKKPDLYNTSPTSAMVKAYTVIGIQQRGMSSYAGIGNGRFEPLPVKSKEFLKVCDGKDLTPAPGKSHYDLRDFTSCECNLPEESNPWSRCLGVKEGERRDNPGTGSHIHSGSGFAPFSTELGVRGFFIPLWGGQAQSFEMETAGRWARSAAGRSSQIAAFAGGCGGTKSVSRSGGRG